MLKKTITYETFDGKEMTEDFYFNLTKTEIMEMEMSESGGLSETLKKIVAEDDKAKIIAMFKDIILKAYGEKSPDGKRFIKSEEQSKAFSQTGAYDELFMSLTTDAEAASAFINGLLPKDLNKFTS